MDIFSILVTLLLIASTKERYQVQGRQMGYQNQGFPRGPPGPQQQWQQPQNQAQPQIQQSNPQFGNDPRLVAPQNNFPHQHPIQQQRGYENPKAPPPQSDQLSILGNQGPRNFDENEMAESHKIPEMQELLDVIDHEVEEIVEAVVERLEEDEAMAIELERQGFDPDVYSSTKSMKLSGCGISIVLGLTLSVFII